MGLKSTSSVHAHLETLEKNGYIRKDPTKPRAIEILDDQFNLSRREMVNVPIVGTVTAGQPILTLQAEGGAAGAETEVAAPMPGTMVRIEVAAGDEVKAGDVVAVIEAMKMETEIKSAVNGVVAEVMVNPKDVVVAGQTILTIKEN